MNDTGRVVMLYPLKCCTKCGCLSIGTQLMFTENSTNHLRVVNFWAKLTEIEWVCIGCLSTLSLKIMATVIFRGCRTPAAPYHTAQIDIMTVFGIVDDKCCIIFHWVSFWVFSFPMPSSIHSNGLCSFTKKINLWKRQFCTQNSNDIAHFQIISINASYTRKILVVFATSNENKWNICECQK